MIHKEFTFKNRATDFYGQTWQSEQPKASVIIVHGMGEHSNRYQHLAEMLVAHNLTVTSYDNFGHGKTSGKRGHNPSFDAVLDTLDIVIEKTKTLHPEIPIFLYGHSMGGNVVINYVLRRHKYSIHGVIASSPFLKLAFKPPAWKLFLGKIIQQIAPSLTLGNELDPNHISRDPQQVKNYINDPLVHDKVSPNFSLTFIETGTWAIENAGTLKTPMYLFHGTADKIIDVNGTIKFSERTTKASLKLIEGGYHELHNDLCKDEILDNIVKWFESQL